jgi:hypothetical protein
MDEAQFWAIIEAGGKKAGTDPERQLAAVWKRLVKLAPEEIRAFHQLFNRKLADAYTWDLWGAAYLINGGCSDDGFYYFRAWLISRGRAVYEAAVANPDSLAGRTDPDRDDYEFEDLWHIALEAYKEVRRFRRNNYPRLLLGGISTNHLSRPGRRCTCASNSFIAAAVNLTPRW